MAWCHKTNSKLADDLPGPRRNPLDGLDVLEDDPVALVVKTLPLRPVAANAKQDHWVQVLEAGDAVSGVEPDVQLVLLRRQRPMAVERRDVPAHEDHVLLVPGREFDKADRARLEAVAARPASVDVREAVHDLLRCGGNLL